MSVLGAVFAAIVGSHRWHKASQKLEAVKNVENALSEVAERFKGAQAAAVNLYCSRVHQVPLESMGRDRRAEIYSKFGVHGSSLKLSGSEEKSMRFSLERWAEKMSELFDSIDKMLKGGQIKVVPIGKSEDEEEALDHH